MARDTRDGPRRTCGEPAAFRYTWPGRDEALACAEHAGALRSVAHAIGLHLQLVPVDAGTCEQGVGH